MALSLMALTMVILSSSCSSRSDWLMFRGKQGRGQTRTAITPPIAVKWKLKLQFEENSALSFNPPVIMDNTIYFGSNDGNFYALDIESGYMRWVFRTDGPINSVPAADENYVYFGSNDGNFYCVDRRDGKQIWSFYTGNLVQSSTALYKDDVIFTSDVGATFIFSKHGVEKYRIPNLVWSYHTFQMFEDIMYFAPGPEQNPYSLGAYDTVNRSYLWLLNTRDDNATWYSFAALKGKYLFYSTEAYPTYPEDLAYFALDRRTGLILWEYATTTDLGVRTTVDPARFFRRNLELLDHLAPSLWKNLAIFTSGDTTVRAFHQTRGTVEWTHTFQYPTSSAPTTAADAIYFGLHGDNLSGGEPQLTPDYTSPKLVSLSARNGRLLWQMDIEGSLLSAPVIAGKWIIFGTDKNVFYVLEEVL